MKIYQFKLNGKVVSAKELYDYDLVDYIDNVYNAESVLGDLLQGKVVELYDFTFDYSVDRLQLVEVLERKELTKEQLAQEKLLELYKELTTVKDELISLVWFDAPREEMEEKERNLVKQIKELENE